MYRTIPGFLFYLATAIGMGLGIAYLITHAAG